VDNVKECVNGWSCSVYMYVDHTPALFASAEPQIYDVHSLQ